MRSQFVPTVFTIATVLTLLGIVPGCSLDSSTHATEAAPAGGGISFGSRDARLADFSSAIEELKRTGAGQVRILQIGDSHTAGDVFSGKLRDLLQADYGSAGRGNLPAGVPFEYYRPRQVKVAQQGSWKSHNSYKRGTPGPFGLSGFRLAGTGNASSTMTAKEQPFQTLSLEFVKGSGRGDLSISADGADVGTVSTASNSPGVGFQTVSFSAAAASVSVAGKGNGPVDLLSWGTTTSSSGILFESHGIVGATADVMSKWDASIVRAELQRWDPALILVAYGTNEGFNDSLDVSAYASRFRNYLRFLAAATPNASIVVVGPPDANRVPGFCDKGEAIQCVALSEAERADYTKLVDAKSSALCRWHAPPKLYAVRDAQRRAAEREGFLFWDWSSVMNGECGMHDWVNQDLARQDHVHMSGGGYVKSAEALYRVLRSNM